MDQVGRYRIECEIGRGAMGVVYSGFDPLLKRRVAVKTVLPGTASADQSWDTLMKRLTREAQAAASLSHPNIMGVYDVVPSDEMFSIVMEFIDGKTLAEAAPPGTRPESGFVVRVLKECAAALDHAHSRGIVHRDIKPGNIMLDSGGVAKITDFGIAKLIDSTTELTKGFAIGTLEYMSPEQLNAQPLDGRSDQFSLAAVAYRLLTDSRIFDADSVGAWCAMLMMRRPVPASSRNPALPRAVDAVLDRAMASDPKERYDSCSKFASDLETALTESGAGEALSATRIVSEATKLVAASGPQTVVSARMSPGRRFWIVSGTVFSAVAVTVLVWVGTFTRKPLEVASNAPPSKQQEVMPQASSPVAIGAAPGSPVEEEPPPAAKKEQAKVAPPPAALAPPVASPKTAPKAEPPPPERVPTPVPVIVAAAPPAQVARPLRAGEMKFNPKDGQNYVWIPPGTFMMGCSAGDGECFDNEKPAHQVTLTKGFWIGRTEVTQEAYQRLMGQNSSRLQGPKRPVDGAKWDQAQTFCKAAGMRLPTEAEWEYAARAGSEASGYEDRDQGAWYGGNSKNTTHEPQGKQPNAWGLYDTLGNVWELVVDWYAPYSAGNQSDPSGPVIGQFRVIRGGYWDSTGRDLRLSRRYPISPVGRGSLSPIGWVGVRCAGDSL